MKKRTNILRGWPRLAQLALFAAFLSGLSACSDKNENPAIPSQEELENFTIYETTQAPSRGAVEFPTGAAGLTDFIVVAPDYYGFGITEKAPQAYCISRANGRASLDAYLAAKRLIEDLNQMDEGKLLRPARRLIS